MKVTRDGVESVREASDNAVYHLERVQAILSEARPHLMELARACGYHVTYDPDHDQTIHMDQFVQAHADIKDSLSEWLGVQEDRQGYYQSVGDREYYSRIAEASRNVINQELPNFELQMMEVMEFLGYTVDK